MLKIATEMNKVEKYIPGLSVEEVKNQYSLDTVYKLASNENPLPPPADLVAILRSNLQKINRYPSYTHPVIQAASRYYQVEPSQVVLGNGSSELIDKLMQAYGEPGTSILTSENTFPLYVLCAQAYRLHVYQAPLADNLQINVKEMMSVLEKNHDSIRLIFISNPNNPTGSYISHTEMEELISFNNKVLFILDEAYWGYVRAKDFPDSIALMKKYPNVIVLRSMSKVMGLAGLRAGVMLAHPSVVEFMKKVICPFNVNTLSLQAMLYCFTASSFQKYLEDSKQIAWKGLDYFYTELKRLGLVFYPSQGNFFLFSTPGNIFASLLKKGLILRPINEPGLENHLRMSVGLEEENKKAIELIREVV